MKQNIIEPKFNVGDNIKLKALTKNNKIVKIPGKILTNNTIDYLLLNAVYDIEVINEQKEKIVYMHINEQFIGKA